MTTSSSATAAATRARLLRDPGAFRTLWWSRSVSFTGDGVGRTALVLVSAEQGPTAVSLVLLAVALPRFLGPIAGALADRLEQRRLMAVCEVGQAAMFAAMAAFLPPLPILLALVLVASGFATAFTPAGRSAVPALVSESDLGRANALLGTAFNIQLAVGPTIGGLAMEFAGARYAFAANALAFVISAIVLTRLPTLHPQSTQDDRLGLWSSTISGLRYVATTPGPRALIIFLFLLVSFAAIDNVALVFLVEDHFGGTETEFGLVQACYGVGMLAASGILGLILGRQSATLLLVVGTVLVAAGTTATVLAPTPGPGRDRPGDRRHRQRHRKHRQRHIAPTAGTAPPARPCLRRNDHYRPTRLSHRLPHRRPATGGRPPANRLPRRRHRQRARTAHRNPCPSPHPLNVKKGTHVYAILRRAAIDRRTIGTAASRGR